ncbi:MAG: glycosyltransferase [Clostridia bacterium]|nr:glycosyltransferase [Clostridia bacterium]
MKFSVLMSVYAKDDPAFLQSSLESIYDSQTVKPDEIIIVFDGHLSPSLTDVLYRFMEGRENVVRFLPQETNRGLGEALRIGQSACHGDYIFRMDADDISRSDRFEKQVGYLTEHPEIDVLGTATEEFLQSPGDLESICSFPAEHERIAKLAKKRNPINHMTVCIRREALMRVGGYETMLYLEDYYLWLRMLAAGCRFANLSEPLVDVRVGNGFYARRSANRQVKGWKALQQFMLREKMITRMRATINMLTVRIFVLIPPFFKKWIYRHLMRRKKKNTL